MIAGIPRPLNGRVVAVAGATGAAGHATVRSLAAAGATVACAGTDPRRLDALLDATRRAVPGATVVGQVLDLLDPQAAHDWSDHVEAEHGSVDGLVHLVGGWRGSKKFTDIQLSDWDFLHDQLVRTLQHTTLGFHDALLRSPNARVAVVSAAGAAKPTAGNAAYAGAKAAAEAWTLALADSFRSVSAAAEQPQHAAAVILVIKALVTQQMREAKPNAKFAGFTDVADLAQTITDLWNRPAAELNGQHLWLTPR
ncbi:SDR family NAD(P)-dependent oxidoreductase [Streptacidiphilus sp. EB129]|uniref:SDR family NAD(P)-dependent oxidoreductase n=1 Tax=Streptacidiphilus sp. EB129 TaxID=3156262 RepID=UPI003511A391